MIIIEITELHNGGHNNQTINGAGQATFPVPDGWAIIPEGMETPNFPFGNVTVDNQTPPVVTSWTPLPIPEPEPAPDPEPTADERISALEAENQLLNQQVAALTDQNDFQEELIVELANIVYA